jgi:hypothetical protein
MRLRASVIALGIKFSSLIAILLAKERWGGFGSRTSYEVGLEVARHARAIQYYGIQVGNAFPEFFGEL